MNIFKTKLLGLALAGLILGACSQTGTYETADLMNEQAAAEKAGFKLDPFGTVGNANALTLTGGGNPATDCITSTSGDAFKAEGDLSNTWGGGPNNFERNLEVVVWNTPTTIEYRFTLTTTASGGGQLQFFDESLTPDAWVNLSSISPGVTFPVSRPLPAGWKAGDPITEQWRMVGQGGQVELGDVTYNLIGICTTTTVSKSSNDEICINGGSVEITGTVTASPTVTGGVIKIQQFNGTSWVDVPSASEAVGDGIFAYTFSPTTVGTFTFRAAYDGTGTNGFNSSVSDGITVTTKSCVPTCTESFSYVENANGTITFTYKPEVDMDDAKVVLTFAQTAVVSIPGFTPNGATMQATLDLEACETYTWTATISELRCTGVGQTNVNAWTDMTVNTVSKKGTLDNIVRPCSN